MTDVAEENRFLLLEFIANLLAKDYTETLDGLSEMGFIPKDIVQGDTTHPINPSVIHPINTPYQEIMSTHPINPPYQEIMSTHPINPPYQHTLSTHL